MTALPILLLTAALAAPTDADVQDVLVLSAGKPVLLRLHVRVAGQPCTTPWEDYLKTLFTYLDRDSNGELSDAEAARAPKAAPLVRQLRGGGFGFFGTADTLATRAEIAGDPAVTKVDFAAFKNYYRRSGLKPLLLQVGPDAGARALANASADALFRHLDLDRDGKLARAELEQAEKPIRALDANDDEVVTIRELLGDTPPTVPAAAAAGVVLLLLERDLPWPAEVLRLRDGHKDQKLSRAESDFDAADFQKLDQDGDGLLTAAELARLPAVLTPAVELTVQVRPPDKAEAVTLAPGLAKSLLAQPSSSGLTVTVGASQFNFWRHDAVPTNNYANFRKFHLGQFHGADPGKKGFVTKEDLTGAPRQLLLSLFPLADRDDDGKLTEAELLALFDLQDQVARCYLSLGVADHGAALLHTLDENQDSRLSAPELRRAWPRFAPWSKDGAIARADVPTRWQLTVAAGPPVFQGGARLQMNAPAPMPTAGPAWFRKMDRNGDGVVSLREFLGDRKDFERLDKNKDGLIDQPEAELAEPPMAKP